MTAPVAVGAVTVTGSVKLALPPLAARSGVATQLISWPLAVQAQPLKVCVPLQPGVTPAGKVLRTVTGPVVAAAPTLV